LCSGRSPATTRDSTSFKTEIPDYRAALKTEAAAPGNSAFRRNISARGSIPRSLAPWSRRSPTTSLGCEIKEVSLPHTQYCLDTYYIIATAEASSNLARYDGIRYGHPLDARMWSISTSSRAPRAFGAEVKRRIILGTYVLSSGYYDAYYLRGHRRSARSSDRISSTPTARSTCSSRRRRRFPRSKSARKADPLAMYLCDIYTIGVNLAGLPAISVPCGFTQADSRSAAADRPAFPRSRPAGRGPSLRTGA
jgi:aspartyl-tRNA(Asn)/glutamyl-tRNA(Gln) amidotransferase subunit A